MYSQFPMSLPAVLSSVFFPFLKKLLHRISQPLFLAYLYFFVLAADLQKLFQPGIPSGNSGLRHQQAIFSTSCLPFRPFLVLLQTSYRNFLLPYFHSLGTQSFDAVLRSLWLCPAVLSAQTISVSLCYSLIYRNTLFSPSTKIVWDSEWEKQPKQNTHSAKTRPDIYIKKHLKYHSSRIYFFFHSSLQNFL